MKRMAVLCLLLLCVRAAWAENFSAYEIKTHGFPIFAPNVIMDNGDMFFHTWDDRAGTIGKDHPWHLEWMETCIGIFRIRTTIRVRGTHHPLCRSAMNVM